MIGNWSNWKKFPNVERGEHIEAPIGPGIFEVRNMSTGDLAAFDAWRGHDLEYRTCPASSVSEAKMMVQALLGRRKVYWRRSAGQARPNLAGSV